MFGCAKVCDGVSNGSLKRLTENSSQCGRLKMIISGNYTGNQWRDIAAQEMYYFHGVILKTSIDNRVLGGYTASFKQNIFINLRRSYSVTLIEFLLGRDSFSC